MKIATLRNFVIYSCCTWGITGTLHATGNAPWNEIDREEYAYLEGMPEKHPAKALVGQALEDQVITNMEYGVIKSFRERFDEDSTNEP